MFKNSPNSIELFVKYRKFQNFLENNYANAYFFQTLGSIANDFRNVSNSKTASFLQS